MQIHLSDHFTYRKLLRFTFPTMVMMVFTSIYGVVDGLFVTNFVGKTALAAINFVFPVLNILATFGYMFGLGGSALVAKVMGEGKRERANSLFSLFVYITGILGVVFALLGFFLLRPLLSALGAQGELLDACMVYGRVLLVSLPLWNYQFLFQIFFVTAERPKLGLYVTVLAGISNIVLDALFVAVFKWGIAGAAIATALSQIVGGGIPLIYFAMKNGSLLRLGRAKIDGSAMLRGTLNGSSELVNGISGSLVGILYNTQLIKYAGETGVAAHSIMMYVTMIFIGIFFGYTNGVAPVISYHYGAQNLKELRSLRKKSTVIIAAASVLMFAISEVLARPLSLIFAGYDAALFDMTLGGFRIFAVSFLFSGLCVFGSSFFTALNNGLASAIISFMRTIVFQVVCVLAFAALWGLDGIWYSIVAAEALSVIVTVSLIAGLKNKYYY